MTSNILGDVGMFHFIFYIATVGIFEIVKYESFVLSPLSIGKL